MPRKRKGGKSRGTPRASAPAPAPAAAQVPGPTSASGPGHPQSLSRPRIDGTARGKAQGTQAAPAAKRGTRKTSQGGSNAKGEADGASVGTSTSGRWRLTWQHFLVAVTVGVALGAVLFQVMSTSHSADASDAPDDAVPIATRDDWMCHPKRLPPRIVWNRIYKTGGVPLARYIGDAAEKHGWTYARSNIFDFFVTQRNEELRMEIAVAVTTADFPGGKVGDKPVSFRGRALDSSAEEPTPAMLFDQSMAFVDYTQWGLPQPAYLNLIRHPLERIVQNFQQMKRYQSKRPDKFPCTWNVTFNQCVEQRRTRTCMVASSCGANNLMTHTMCGSHGVCKDPSSKEALAQALHNLQYRYAVVGVLEYLPASMDLLAAVLPGYFESLPALVEASDIYDAKGMPTAESDTPVLDAASLSPANLRYLVETNANDVKLYRAALRLLRRRVDTCGVEMRRTRDVVADRASGESR